MYRECLKNSSENSSLWEFLQKVAYYQKKMLKDKLIAQYNLVQPKIVIFEATYNKKMFCFIAQFIS